MMQVGVHTTVTWDITDRARVVSYMQAQQQGTREMPNCLACWWTADLDDPVVFHEWEWWDSEDAFNDHARNGPKFSAEARSHIRRVLTYRYDIARVTKLH
jgi:quinol monooxygenase YgiN